MATVCRARQCCTSVILALLICAGFPDHAVAQRATSLTLLPNALTLESVVYEPNTPPDLTKAATGTGKLTLAIGDASIGMDGVKFTNLIFDAGGTLKGVEFTLDRAIKLERVAGCTVEIPTGKLAWVAPGVVT